MAAHLYVVFTPNQYFCYSAVCPLSSQDTTEALNICCNHWNHGWDSEGSSAALPAAAHSRLVKQVGYKVVLDEVKCARHPGAAWRRWQPPWHVPQRVRKTRMFASLAIGFQTNTRPMSITIAGEATPQFLVAQQLYRPVCVCVFFFFHRLNN